MIASNGKRKLWLYGFLIAIPLVSVILILSGVLSGIWPRSALQDAHERVGFAAEFSRLYPDSEAHFAYFLNPYYDPILNITTGQYGRYKLTMSVDVKFDWTRTRISSVGSPRFYLTEIRQVSFDDGRVIIISAGGLQMEFGEDEWQKIVNGGGDLSVLGVEIVKDEPVPNFDRAWRLQ